MSLFDVREFWCAIQSGEDSCGCDSLATADIDEDGCDEIIIGSYNGFIRIYRPEYDPSDGSKFRPSSLLIESSLLNPVLHVAVGRFVSLSKALHVAVLHPRSFSVYGFSSVLGSVEHGNQYELKLVYEHKLNHSSYKLVFGNFGGVKNRDFLCAVALDGTLAFFEQETFMAEVQLPLFLIPSPVVYVPQCDFFVVMNSDWTLEAFKYQSLLNTKSQKPTATWTSALQEPVIDMVFVIATSGEAYLVVLTDRNLICLHGNGSMKFTKRLQHTPVCFFAYINENTNKITTLIVSDSGILSVCVETVLHWGCKLPITPIAIRKGNFERIKGAIVTLAENCEVKCCYLGTQPCLYKPPPLENSVLKYKDVARRFAEIDAKISAHNSEKGETLSLQEVEIIVNTKIFYSKIDQHCVITLDITPSGPLNNVHIAFQNLPPFSLQPDSYLLTSLCESTELCTVLRHNSDAGSSSIYSETVTVTVTYINSNGVVHVLRKSITVPLRFFIAVCKQPKDATVSATLDTNQPPVPLSTLFQEFVDNSWTGANCNDEYASFCFLHNCEKWCIVRLRSSTYGYEISSDDLPSLYLLVAEIVLRCRSRQREKKQFVFGCSDFPIWKLFALIDKYSGIRNEIKRLEGVLEKLCGQFRLIQRRLLIKFKERVPSPVSNLQVLYSDIHEKIFEISRNIEEKQKEYVQWSCDMNAGFQLLALMMCVSCNVTQEDVHKIKNAIIPSLTDFGNQDWKEMAEASLTYILNSHFKLQAPQNLCTNVGPDRLENMLLMILDHFGKDFYEKLPPRAVSPIPEADEEAANLTTPSSSRPCSTLSNLKRDKLLPKRPVAESVIKTVNTETVDWRWYGEI